MQQAREGFTESNGVGVRRGTVSFTPNGTTDILSPRFFGVDYRFVVDDGDGYFGWFYCANPPCHASSLAEADEYPNIWAAADILAKAAYSTVLTDLGQTAAVSNILTDSDLLTHFTSDIGNLEMANYEGGPANASFAALEATTGPLGTTPSVIATTYICQVPRLKTRGDIIIAILVADLVLLRAVWQIYKLLTEVYLGKKRSTANHCEGCLSRARSEKSGDTIALLTPGHEDSSQYLPLIVLPQTESGGGGTRKSTYETHFDVRGDLPYTSSRV